LRPHLGSFLRSKEVIRVCRGSVESSLGSETLVRDSTDGIQGVQAKRKAVRVSIEPVRGEKLWGRFETPLCTENLIKTL